MAASHLEAIRQTGKLSQVARPFSKVGLLPGLALVFVLGLLLSAEPVPLNAQVKNPIAAVNKPEQRDADLIEFDSCEQLEGKVLNQTFKLRTAYGEFQLPLRDIDRLTSVEALSGLVRVTTVNSNLLTGFLRERAINLSTNGSVHNFRPDTLSYLQVAPRGSSISLPPRPMWIRLRNGDRLSGNFLTNSLFLTGSTAKREVAFPELQVLQFRSDNSDQVSVWLTNGTTFEGTLAGQDLPFRLELGPAVELPIDTIEFIGADARLATGAPEERAGRATSVNSSASTNFAGMVYLPPGEFLMGSPTEELGRDPDESPQTRVVIARGFWMGECEVTQGEYQQVMGLNPSNGTGDRRRPVERVSWFDAVEYCKKLTQACELQGRLPEGYVYRLPTEAEWEYGCRAGATTRFCYGEDKNAMRLSDYAWFSRNSESTTHPVGTRQPNAWGLFDMHGNVWEWCLDRWEDALPGGTITNSASAATGNLRVARGGSWLYDAKACRAANRDDYSPFDRCSDIGFRVVLAPLGAAP